MIHDPYSVTKRTRLTDKQRLELLIANGGKCCICGRAIVGYRESWDDYDLAEVPFVDEHIEPLWRNGTNRLLNRAPAHEKCARRKTSEEATQRAKGRHVAEKHFGAHKPKGRPLPGSKRSGWKKKLDGTVERR